MSKSVGQPYDTITFLKTQCTLDPKESIDSIAIYRGLLVGAEIQVEISATECRAWATGVDGRFTAKGKGATLAECEKVMLSDIGKLRRFFGIFCIYVQAPADIAEACADFVGHWGKLPPLVRAGYGDGMVQKTTQERASRAYHVTEEGLAEFGRLLPRRKRVHQLFRVASRIVGDFAVALTQQADDEAEAEGLDQDVRYAVEDEPIAATMNVTVEIKEGLEKELLKRAGEEVMAEQDRQVLAEAMDGQFPQDMSPETRHVMLQLRAVLGAKDGESLVEVARQRMEALRATIAPNG